MWGCPRGVMVEAMDCEIIVSEFEIQLRSRAITFTFGQIRNESPYPRIYG